ncbi:MAG: LysR family transcriptional regulator [Comamonas sp.]
MNSNDALKTEQLWSHLWWLVVLEQQGSFTAAAARLGVSKAAVSQHIAGLERAAGVPLVRRTTRSMLLTEAGRHLVQDTRESFARIAGSFAQVRDLADALRGGLRVTAPVALARQHLVPRLPEFLDKYPDIQLELDLSDQLRPLSQQGLDLAIRHTSTPPENHVAWALCTTHSVLVASQSYLERHGPAPAAPDDLRQHRCLHYPRGQEAAAWTLQRLGRGGGARTTVPVSGPLVANNSEALRDAAMAGLGIALVPDFSAQAALASGQLVAVLPQWRPMGAFSPTIYAMRPYSAHVPRAVGVFVEWVREVFAPGFAPQG